MQSGKWNDAQQCFVSLRLHLVVSDSLSANSALSLAAWESVFYHCVGSAVKNLPFCSIIIGPPPRAASQYLFFYQSALLDYFYSSKANVKVKERSADTKRCHQSAREPRPGVELSELGAEQIDDDCVPAVMLLLLYAI